MFGTKFHREDLVEKYCRLGIAKKNEGDVQAALELFTKAIEESNEASLRAWSLRADLNQVEGHFQDALNDYNRVLKIMPTHVPTLTSAASCFKRMKETAKALKMFDFILTFEGKVC